MDIRSGHHHAQWPASPVDQDALLAPSLAPVSRIASNSPPPKRAFPIEQSADCHSQFTPSNPRHSSIRTAQTRSSTPRSTQRWKVRWMGLSFPSSLGKWFHWQELRLGKMTPSSTSAGPPVCAPSPWASPTPKSPVQLVPLTCRVFCSRHLLRTWNQWRDSNMGFLALKVLDHVNKSLSHPTAESPKNE